MCRSYLHVKKFVNMINFAREFRKILEKRRQLLRNLPHFLIKK